MHIWGFVQSRPLKPSKGMNTLGQPAFLASSPSSQTRFHCSCSKPVL
jgi:hypothetical protein